MAAIDTVCLLGFGEVGAVLAEDLLKASPVRLVVWDKLFSVPGSQPNQRLETFASYERVDCADSDIDAVANADLVISAVTAEQAIPVVNAVKFALRPQTWFLDLNSVSPATKIQAANIIDAGGGRYVEAAVMSPISPHRINTRIALSGKNAAQFLPLAKALGFGGMTFVSEKPGQAAAGKMCRSVVIKGMESLIGEALLTARYYGVEEEVLSSLGNLFPHADWRNHARYMISRTLEHGTRRAEEMREVVKTVREAGITPWMSEACIASQSLAGGLQVDHDLPELSDMLDAIRHSLSATDENSL